MSASADNSQLICRKCGASLRRVGKCVDRCVACLLELALDEEQVLAANAGQFDHYNVATHTDGTPFELGRGAMGITFKAFDTVLGNEVALKVIDARIAAHPEARERFLREARAAARLRHPNIASVFYYGKRKSDGQCFYAMELVEGETLKTRLGRSGPLPPALALEVITQAARALVALEVHGLVHRDLKPANLMLVEQPELIVKMIDFGLAKAAATAESGSDITHGDFVGTPSFASPEQFTNTSVVDLRSDLYSLGITLWEMLTGQTPFCGTPREVMHQHQHALLPLDLLEAVPQPVVVLLDALLEKDPGRRFQTPADLLNAIPIIIDAIDARRRITRQSLQHTSSSRSLAITRRPQAKSGPEKISVARLPVTGSDVFGREEDIAFLDDAWANEDVNVVTIVAWAGVGKSTLVNHWLRRMAAKHYRPAELVFGWSFYRQGSSGDTSSADEFLDAALKWFGDPDPRLGTAWEKGERLAKLVARRSEAELRSASNEFSGHCLALTLLGSYLTDAYDGDIRCRNEVSGHLAEDVRQGAHARKAMESYQTWLGEGPETSVLRMLGLFDRPVDEKDLKPLLTSPEIPDLTESLTDLRPTAWRTILARLRRARLLAAADPHHPENLDTHPLVREYFGEQLRCQRTEAWKEGNRRLYGYYRTLAPQLPKNFREMEPLFLATICACRAGLFREALHEVYLPRIQRGDVSYAAKVLGARGALLSMLIHFFEHAHWESPVEIGLEEQSLSADDQLFILSEAALYLTALRGFQSLEANICYQRVESLCHSLRRPHLLYVALTGQWRYAYMTNNPKVALEIAERVRFMAQEQDDPAQMIGAYNLLAGTLYYLGNFETAHQSVMRGVQIWRSGSVKPNPGAGELESCAVVCLGLAAMCEWHLGKTGSSQTLLDEANTLAEKLNEMSALALVLQWATNLAYYEGKPIHVERLAAESIELSTRQNFARWLTHGTILRGWARSASGDTVQGIAWIEDGIRDYRVTGTIQNLPFFLALKAEALHLAGRTSEALEAIREAEALVERSGERSWCAELHRLRGVFLAAIGGDKSQIEASFCEAIRLAKEQMSVSLGKRAEASYADYRRQHPCL